MRYPHREMNAVEAAVYAQAWHYSFNYDTDKNGVRFEAAAEGAHLYADRVLGLFRKSHGDLLAEGR